MYNIHNVHLYWYNTGFTHIKILHTQLKAYAKEQGIPPPNSNLKGIVADYSTLPRGRGVGPSFQTFIDLSNILLHCLIFLTFLSASYYIYKAVYKNGKINPSYGACWAIVLFSIDIFFVTLLLYDKDAVKDPVLIIFLVLESVVSIMMAIIFTYLFKSENVDLELPIPLVSITNRKIEDILSLNKKCSFPKLIAIILMQATAIILMRATARWFPVATLHVFLYNIIRDRTHAFLTNPLETFIELVFYLSLAICFFVTLNLPFYIKKPQCWISWEIALTLEIFKEIGLYKEVGLYIIKLLNIGVLLTLISIAGFSTRYVTLTLSHSQDSDARLLIAVLPTVAVTAVVALKWPYIKRFVERLQSQNHTN